MNLSYASAATLKLTERNLYATCPVPMRLAERAVLHALAGRRPMRLRYIHAAVERALERAVPVEAVSWCLRAGSRKETPTVVRPARGYYQLRPQT